MEEQQKPTNQLHQLLLAVGARIKATAAASAARDTARPDGCKILCCVSKLHHKAAAESCQGHPTETWRSSSCQE